MLKIGYGAEHEQYQPLRLLEFVVEAEKAGFDSIWTSDHFHPWAHANAAGGFPWVWMAAAAERTKSMEVGTNSTCPFLRYHPAIVAQAFATLRNMYPERIFLDLGTGMAMNEVPLGYEMPPFEERAERLEEAIKIIKSLWSESFVNFRGKYYTLRKANLYTKPSSPPPLYVDAIDPRIAEIAGKYADGFLTAQIFAEQERHRSVIMPALERGARSVGRNPENIVRALEIFMTYDEDYSKAVESARFWAAGLVPAVSKAEISDPRELEENARIVGDAHIAQAFSVGTSPEYFIKELEKCVRMGFQHIYVVSSSPDEIKAIRMYGKHVLPYIRSTYGK